MIRDRLRRHRPNAAALRAIALAIVYATLSIGALSIAFGITAFVWVRVGLYAGVAVGGVFAFAYPATVLYAIHLTNQGSDHDRQPTR